MQTFKLKKGLDLPVEGAPDQTIHPGPEYKTVGVLGGDYIGLKPKMLVQEGDAVQRGAPLFCHKDAPDAMMVAPVSGKVVAINRGARRVLQSVVIEVSDANDTGVDFSGVGDADTAEGVTAKLCAAGLWTAFRTRPYSKMPEPGSAPAAIFVTAMDSDPLAADAAAVIQEASDTFTAGLNAISKLTEGATYLCQKEGDAIPGADVNGVETAAFSGPHPSGLAGTHIHFLEPLTGDKQVWTIGYQDVIAIGRLLLTGHLDPNIVVALSGPGARQPRLVRTVMGASTDDLTRDEVNVDGTPRIISGSILSGQHADGPTAYLGRFARQISIIREDHDQIPMGWIRPMPSKYSVQPVLGSAFAKKLYAFTSNLNGGRRAMVPTGVFEELMPQDYLPTQLLRALLVMDTDTAQALGALELDEEDLGLVGFACPAKYEYGLALRDCLTKIEKEG
ncbi:MULTISPECIES: Na(+)-translocating NADH-quinone reductase subunit A [unclassified Ruegeria]|uniref:Na(+)-translocating NADH-quinone reductase subunit A n=1 Tax=unclassified Ruegeria TaxID=2625375 RepID=UPI001490F85B|nr:MULTISPECIES: Na(+)-translocating NADH-quinone reductase subunit A [unclassified Ruegeria]NOD47536.1 Na(+)-translocating NADH-quinone reductase subunit A [Ruegeria sp. HKCCD5849]NOD53071.1 Na(+)-translocating NADH-quinone reductase subunit A [Ruegeria sp. HKCCD5851]NOD66264.1 Na(+)-translocating NADH-quinone reductase subunit A [Ruegeria sp. HKCCD7303]